MIGLCREIAHLVVGVALGEGQEQRGFLGVAQFGYELATRARALGHGVAQLLAQGLVHRGIAAHQRIAHAVGLGNQLVELVVGVGAHMAWRIGTPGRDAQLEHVVVAVVAVARRDAVGVGNAGAAVQRVVRVQRAVTVLVDRLDLVAIGVEAVLDGVARRQARHRIRDLRRHLETQPVGPVVDQIRDVEVRVLDLHHVAGGVVRVGGDVALGIRHADALVFSVVAIPGDLSLRDLQLQPRHHRQQVLVPVVAVLRDLAVGGGFEAQQAVLRVLVAGGDATVVGHRNAIAFGVVADRARVLHRRRSGVGIVVHRSGLDQDKLAARVVGVGGDTALGIRDARPVAHIVHLHLGAALLLARIGHQEAPVARAVRAVLDRRASRRGRQTEMVCALHDHVVAPPRHQTRRQLARRVEHHRLPVDETMAGQCEQQEGRDAQPGVRRGRAARVLHRGQQLVVAVVDARRGDAVGIRHADAVAHRVVHKTCRPREDTERLLHRDQAVVGVVGVEGGIARGIFAAGQVAEVVVDETVAVALAIGDRREIAEGVVDVGAELLARLRNDPEAAAAIAVGSKCDCGATEGPGQLEAVRAQALDVVGTPHREARRQLPGGREHHRLPVCKAVLGGRERDLGRVGRLQARRHHAALREVHRLRHLVAVGVVGEAREITARVDLRDQVLSGVVEEFAKPALGRQHAAHLVEGGVGPGGGVAAVVAAREQVATIIVDGAGGELLEQGLFVGEAQARQIARKTQRLSQVLAVIAVAVGRSPAVAIGHRGEVALGVVAVGRLEALLVTHAGDSAVGAVPVGHRLVVGVFHRGAAARVSAARLRHRVAEERFFALGIADLRQHLADTSRGAGPVHRRPGEIDLPLREAHQLACHRLLARQTDREQITLAVVDVARDVTAPVRDLREPAVAVVGVAREHHVGLVDDRGELAAHVAVTQHVTQIVRDALQIARAVVGVAHAHAVGVDRAKEPACGAEPELRVVGTRHHVRRHRRALHLQRLEGLRSVRRHVAPAGGIEPELGHRAIAVAQAVDGLATDARDLEAHIRAAVPALVVECTRGTKATARVVGADEFVVFAAARQEGVLMAVDQVAARHVDEHLIAVVGARRAGLIVAAEKVERGIPEAGFCATDQNGHSVVPGKEILTQIRKLAY